MVEKDNSNWTVRLTAYDNSSLSRLSNCSIYIYNGSNSTQIVILNGDYENQTGPWIDLNASDTEYIWMHVETSSAGTSSVYVHLEICTPDTTTYAQYLIEFRIT
jgi:predicted ATPase